VNAVSYRKKEGAVPFWKQDKMEGVGKFENEKTQVLPCDNRQCISLLENVHGAGSKPRAGKLKMETVQFLRDSFSVRETDVCTVLNAVVFYVYPVMGHAG
jgi:hypothetical protein